MKVVYYAHSLLSRGGDKMVLAHAGWLISHGHEVEFCCNVVDTVLDIPERVRFSRPSLSGLVGTIVSAFLERRDADVVLASIIPMACFLFPRSRRKVVYFAQDYDESYYTSPLQIRLVRCFYKIGLSLLRIPTIAVSHSLADLLGKRFHAKVSVAENGVDSGVFYPDPDVALLAVKENRRAILILSRSDRRKGFDIAREVIRGLIISHSDGIEVWTVGEACPGFAPEVVHRDFGYVGEEKLRQIMSSADVLLYPTRHEGFGLMPLEAMACGCPVVTTEAVSFALHLENALVANVGSIQQITANTALALSDKVLRKRLTDSGLILASRLTLDETKKQFEKALIEITTKGLS